MRLRGVWKKATFEVKLIVPHMPKTIRFNNHLQKIRNKKILLPENAIWREACVAEVIGFPGEIDDHVDAMTQYLDFMDTDPVVPLRAPRESGVVVFTWVEFSETLTECHHGRCWVSIDLSGRAPMILKGFASQRFFWALNKPYQVRGPVVLPLQRTQMQYLHW